MLRRIVATLSLAVIGLLAVPTLAFANNPPYPAPPVTPATESWQPPTSVGEPYTALASTGAGFSVETAIVIGALVLLVGIGLLVLGNRLRRSNTPR